MRHLAIFVCATASVFAAAAPAPRVLYLVRHGAYASDPKADPRWGPGLLPIGVAQARLAAARLAGLPFAFDAVYASPLIRARETALVIAAELPGARVQILPELEECTPPTWRTEEVSEETPAAMAACAATLDRLFARLFVPAAGSARHELLVCHGNVIRYLVTKALRVDTKSWLEMSVGHASLTVIRVQADGSFKLITVGDVGHLPTNLQSGASDNPEPDLSVPQQ
ncbi:MAG: histidine phosphatase family protein [Acidobacteria bacterium]|nr:histidine phosphatase family protein [Acidobacteriota bacterium]